MGALALPSLALAADPPAPTDVAVDAEGNLLVTDYVRDRVLKFSPDGMLQLEWGSFGTALGQFRGPFGVAVHGEQAVYVVDQLNNRVQRFSPEGAALEAWGSAGAGGGELRTPFGVASSSAGIYVADFGNDRVQMFSHGGQLLRVWGGRGTGHGQFTRPAGVAVDGEGNVYVSDHFNNRVQKFTAEGEFLAEIGVAESALVSASPRLVAARVADGTVPEKQLVRPEGLATDHAGNLYVADYGRDRVVKFSPDGRFLLAWGGGGSGLGQFAGPKGLAVDGSAGSVYVADTGNGRIQRFGTDGTFETAWLLP